MKHHLNFQRTGLAAALLACVCGSPALAVSVANVDIEQFNFLNDSINSATPSVSIEIPTGESGFTTGLGPRVRGGNRGDYDISWDANSTDDTQDAAFGVQLSFAAQNYTTFVDNGGIPMTQVVTTASAVSGDLENFSDVNYFLPVFTAGTGGNGGEWNSNVAAAYFPFSEGWIAGSAYNSSNGGEFVIMNAGQFSSTGINIVELGTGTSPGTFVDGGNGSHQLYLSGSHASSNTTTDGLLFVNGAKNEDNYALSQAAADGSHFKIFTKDNGDNAGGSEQDPVSFVYLPLSTLDGDGNPLHMGKVTGDGTLLLSSGNPTIIPGATPGQYTLTLPTGNDPSTGTLMISPEGSDNTDDLSIDNIVTYQDNGAGGWNIETRDLGSNVPGLQAADESLPAFSFAFIPFDAPPTAPGAAVGSSPTSTPEPASAVLAASALMLLALRAKRQCV